MRSEEYFDLSVTDPGHLFLGAIRRSPVGVDQDRLNVGEILGQSGRDRSHDMADRSGTVKARNADDKISLADFMNLSSKVGIHCRFLPHGHWELAGQQGLTVLTEKGKLESGVISCQSGFPP